MNKMKFVEAKFFCGTATYSVENPKDDLTGIDPLLPASELFDVCAKAMAFRWSHTGNAIHHIGSMRSNGAVMHYGAGQIIVHGRGWNVVFESEEFRANVSSVIERKDWAALNELMANSTKHDIFT